MAGDFSRLRDHLGEPLFAITHSDRPFEAAKCQLNYLEARYQRKDRLPPSEPFHELTSAASHAPYGGCVTLHTLDMNPGRAISRLVCTFRPPGLKPQHAIWYDHRLWVLGVDGLDVYNADLEPILRVDDPWLAGCHTIAPDHQGRLVISCSSSDAVLVVDAVSLRVVRALRVPESLYGHNYPLTRTDSVVQHYITNDQQLAHVNGAWPHGDDVLVSSLIPGAIGRFRPDGSYEELLRGFVGCHGIRTWGDAGGIYFSDSCTGLLVFVDRDLRITQRLDTDSKWLHDALHLGGNVFAVARYDHQVVEFWDVRERRPIGELNCAEYGAPQFLSYGC